MNLLLDLFAKISLPPSFSLLALGVVALAGRGDGFAVAQVPNDGEIRVGMIGLDTSHTVAFAKLIQAAEGSDTPLGRLRLVAAYPGGSSDIPSSIDRVPGYTDTLREMNVEIVDSVEGVLDRVDAVFLTSLDGRTHLAQAIPVFRSQKPCFIDKPLAADLTDAVAIHRVAESHNARWFTSSSLRFTPTIWRYRERTDRKILGAHAWSPCSLEPHHVDLAWYGIHGIEALFTAMGTGCESVSRTQTDGGDVVVGKWLDGRIGVFRGIRSGSQGYGLTVFGADFIESDAKYEGYGPMVERIAEFFAGGPCPVDPQESLEIMAFIQAAQRSSEQGGGPVSVREVMEQAHRDAGARIEALQEPNPHLR